MLSVVCVVLAVVLVEAHPGNRDKIPNGHQVPDPCHQGKTWQPVGHLTSNPQHVQPNATNPFGQDFLAAAAVWTRHLCHQDSDGDGKTNGVELGDPHCNWSIGGTPSDSATGHPGINEKTFDCSGIIG